MSGRPIKRTLRASGQSRAATGRARPGSEGRFCHDIRRILAEVGREGDYIELSLDGRLTWNPLSAPWLDSYSLAYTVASLLNQLFGKGKEPFWQH